MSDSKTKVIPLTKPRQRVSVDADEMKATTEEVEETPEEYFARVQAENEERKKRAKNKRSDHNKKVTRSYKLKK